jgi:hypothetical protein
MAPWPPRMIGSLPGCLLKARKQPRRPRHRWRFRQHLCSPLLPLERLRVQLHRSRQPHSHRFRRQSSRQPGRSQFMSRFPLASRNWPCLRQRPPPRKPSHPKRPLSSTRITALVPVTIPSFWKPSSFRSRNSPPRQWRRIPPRSGPTRASIRIRTSSRITITVFT